MYFAHKVFSTQKRLEPTSPGELLWYCIRSWLHGHLGQRNLAINPEDIYWADPKRRQVQFLNNTLISSVCVRLTNEARSVFDRVLDQIPGANEDLLSSEVTSRLKQFCVDPLGMSFSDPMLGMFSDFAFKCAQVAGNSISDATRKNVLSEVLAIGSGVVTCYLCGDSIGSRGQTAGVTLDHIWPRSFGGVSQAENLLPACRSCNEIKMNRISWDVFGIIQDYALADLSTEGRVLTKMALHWRAAIKIAESECITQKEAFVKLGAHKTIQLTHADEANWFFNGTAHDLNILTDIW